MRQAFRRITAYIMTTVILASGCGSRAVQNTMPDESQVAATIDKIQIEIGYDGDEQLGEELRKIAAGFNGSQEKYEAVVDEEAGAWYHDVKEEGEAGLADGEAGQSEAGLADGEAGQSEAGLADGEAELSEAGLTDSEAGLSEAGLMDGEAGSSEAELTDGSGMSASVIFTGDDVAASYAEDDRRLDLREFMSSEVGACPLYDAIASLPTHMYETVYDDARGVYYLPVKVTAPVFYYNKTVYDALALTLPKSYKELGENCAAIYAKHRMPGYLAYDLEGDIAAMLREQESLAGSSDGTGFEGQENAAGDSDDTGFEGQENAADDSDGTMTMVQESTAGDSDGIGSSELENSVPDREDIMTAKQVLQFFAENCEAGHFRMVHHEIYAARDFATGEVAAFAGTTSDYEMATEGVIFDVGAVPWIMDRENAVYWVDTEGMLFFDQGEERNEGAAAFAEYLLSDSVCSEVLEVTGGISPYRSVYDSQAYRKNRRGFDDITNAVSAAMPQADFVMMSAKKRKEADELLLYMMDGRVTAADAVRILFG